MRTGFVRQLVDYRTLLCSGRAHCVMLLAALCLTVWGCGDYQGTGNSVGPTDLSMSVATKMAAAEPDIVLMPTGDAQQDTENLQAALLDPVMNSGGTLYLGSGVFHVQSSLIRQSFDPGSAGYSPDLFNGTIMGAGKGETIVRSVRGPENEPFGTFMGLPGTFLIWDFTYVAFRGMTFEADSEISEYWEYPGLPPSTGLLSYINLGSGIYGLGGEMGADCRNVHFKGSLDSEGNPEIPLMLEYYGGGGGDLNVQSCEFEDGSFVMADCGALSGTAINYGGKPSEKLTFVNNTDWSVQAISVWGVGDCSIQVSGIESFNATGVSFWAADENTLSHLTVKRNRIHMIPDSWYAGVELWVEPGNGEVSAVVSNNHIHSDDSFVFGPIFMEGVSGALIANNKITGSGSAAIYLGVLEQWPGTASLIGNNLQNWVNTGENPWGFTAAPIWLGSYITNSTVVGGTNSINIFDEPGYDWQNNPLPPDAYGNAQTYEDESVRENIIPKNNVFTGVNNMGGRLVYNAREAMLQKVDVRKDRLNQSMR
jgi:hypothetical protein